MTEEPSDHTCGLYLCVQTGSATAGIERVEALLKTHQIECLLITPPATGEIKPQDALALSQAAQSRQVATLIQDDAQLARTIKADGVHLSWSEDIIARFSDAKDILGSQAIVGADAGRSRHIAMSLGEVGADYVAFGIPAFVSDVEKAQKRQLELVQWWGEIFEIPSVAFDVTSEEQFEMLVANKADFIADTLPPGKTTADLNAWFETRQLALTVKANEKETGDN